MLCLPALPCRLPAVEALQQRAKLLYKAADTLDAAAAAPASNQRPAPQPKQQQQQKGAVEEVVTPAGAIQQLLREGLHPGNIPGLGYTHMVRMVWAGCVAFWTPPSMSPALMSLGDTSWTAAAVTWTSQRSTDCCCCMPEWQVQRPMFPMCQSASTLALSNGKQTL
jgi:hypothetical protein